MTCPAPTFLDRRKSALELQRETMNLPNRFHPTGDIPPLTSNPLERLAQLVIANDHLIDELTSSRARIIAALTYLDNPDCNPRFGNAHLERCRTRHAGILAQLRANRVEALKLLDSPGPHKSEVAASIS